MPRVDPNKLTAKQRNFVTEYMKDMNITATAKRLGISQQAASAYLNKPAVKKELERRIEKVDKKNIASLEEVMDILSQIARGELEEPVLRNCGGGCQTEIMQKPKLRDRTKAAELLARYYGGFTDKINVSGSIGVNIVDDIGDM